MMKKLLARFGYHSAHDQMAQLLTNDKVKEEFLGVADVEMPTSDKMVTDASKLSSYASTEEYRVFAQEVWSRSLAHLDKILDASTTGEKLQFHRGAMNAHLDLLRISYQARAAREQIERERKAVTQD